VKTSNLTCWYVFVGVFLRLLMNRNLHNPADTRHFPIIDIR
jgi:hypothetical protein